MNKDIIEEESNRTYGKARSKFYEEDYEDESEFNSSNDKNNEKCISTSNEHRNDSNKRKKGISSLEMTNLKNRSSNNTLTNSNDSIITNRFKYRSLLKKKLLYDSLDDEEFEEEEVGIFYLMPNSPFIYLLDTLICLSSLISLFYIPIFLSRNNFFNLKIMDNDIIFFVIDFLYIIDLITGFFRAFYNFEEFLIRRSSSIFHNYLRSWLIPDMLMAFPVFTLLYFKKGSSLFLKNKNFELLEIGEERKMPYILMSIKGIKIIKVLSSNKAIESLSDILMDIDFIHDWSYVFLYIFFAVAIINFGSCLFIFIGKNSYPNWIQQYNLQDSNTIDIYVSSIYYLMTTITSVGYGDIICYNIKEHIFQIILLIVGTFTYSWLISSISNYVKKNNEKSIAFEKKVKILDDIKLKNPHFTDSLYDKIMRHLYYGKYNEKIDKNLILESLPYSLRNSLVIEMYRPIVEKFLFFKNFQNSEFIVRVIMAFKPILAIKGDLLVQEGDFIEDIIFVKQGVLSLEISIDLNRPEESVNTKLQETNQSKYSTSVDPSPKNDNKLINNLSKNLKFHNYLQNEEKLILQQQKRRIHNIRVLDIRKNEHFGDILMFLNERSPLSVKVKSKKVELFFLKKTDAIEISSSYPNILKKINMKSLFNMQQTKNLIRKALHIFCNMNGIKSPIDNKINTPKNIVKRAKKKKNQKSEIKNKKSMKSNRSTKSNKSISKVKSKKSVKKLDKIGENFTMRNIAKQKSINDEDIVKQKTVRSINALDCLRKLISKKKRSESVDNIKKEIKQLRKTFVCPLKVYDIENTFDSDGFIKNKRNSNEELNKFKSIYLNENYINNLRLRFNKKLLKLSHNSFSIGSINPNDKNKLQSCEFKIDRNKIIKDKQKPIKPRLNLQKINIKNIKDKNFLIQHHLKYGVSLEDDEDEDLINNKSRSRINDSSRITEQLKQNTLISFNDSDIDSLNKHNNTSVDEEVINDEIYSNEDFNCNIEPKSTLIKNSPKQDLVDIGGLAKIISEKFMLKQEDFSHSVSLQSRKPVNLVIANIKSFEIKSCYENIKTMTKNWYTLEKSLQKKTKDFLLNEIFMIENLKKSKSINTLLNSPISPISPISPFRPISPIPKKSSRRNLNLLSSPIKTCKTKVNMNLSPCKQNKKGNLLKRTVLGFSNIEDKDKFSQLSYCEKNKFHTKDSITNNFKKSSSIISNKAAITKELKKTKRNHGSVFALNNKYQTLKKENSLFNVDDYYCKVHSHKTLSRSSSSKKEKNMDYQKNVIFDKLSRDDKENEPTFFFRMKTMNKQQQQPLQFNKRKTKKKPDVNLNVLEQISENIKQDHQNLNNPKEYFSNVLEVIFNQQMNGQDLKKTILNNNKKSIKMIGYNDISNNNLNVVKEKDSFFKLNSLKRNQSISNPNFLRNKVGIPKRNQTIIGKHQPHLNSLIHNTKTRRDDLYARKATRLRRRSKSSKEI